MPHGWIFSMGTGKYVVDSSAFGKNAQKSPEALHFRGFSPVRPAGVEPVTFRVVKCFFVQQLAKGD